MAVYMNDGEWTCTKHGAFDTASEEQFFQGHMPNGCPKCEEIAEKNLCVECEKHTASEIFSPSTISYVHGDYQKLCKCCLHKKLLECEKKLGDQILELTVALSLNPCGRKA